VQFIVLSDSNATDFNTRVTFPIFKDAGAGRPAWNMMQAGSVKHDTFVYTKAGVRTLLWKASEHSFTTLNADIRAAVVAIGK
jgi:hypothetical protein